MGTALNEERLLSPFDINRLSAETADVAAAYAYPQDSICKLIISTNQGKAGGTGFFIHPRVVLTAGHCVMAGFKQYVNGIAMIPGLKDETKPYGIFGSAQFHVPEKYFNNPVFEWDFGFIILPSPGNTHVKTYFTLVEDVPKPANYQLSGYPADDIPGDELKKGEQVSFANLKISKRLKYQMQIPGSFYPGQSGAPVFYMENNTAYACAVYSGSMPSTSFAVRVTNENILKEYTTVLSKL